MTGKRTVLRVAATLVVLCIAVAAGSAESSTGATAQATKCQFKKPDYKVGAVFALTGVYSGTDLNSFWSMKATVNEINANCGVMGHKLVYSVVDSQSDPAKSALASQQVVDQYKPDVMFPDITCLMALPALPIASKAGLVTFTGCDNGAPSNPSLYPRSFATFPPISRQATDLVAGAKVVMGKTPLKVGFLHSSDAAGNGEVEPLKAAVLLKGGQWVGDQSHGVGDPDVSVQMSKLKDAGANIVILWGQVGDGGVAMKAIRDLNWNVQVLGNSGTVGAALIDEIPDAYKDNYHAVVNAISVRDPKKGLPPFVGTYLQKVSTEVQNLSVAGAVHDGLTLWKWAVERTKTIDADKVTKELEKLQTLPKAQWPKGLFHTDNPAFSPTQHGEGNANLNRAWGLIVPSKTIMGTYAGKVFTCYCDPIKT